MARTKQTAKKNYKRKTRPIESRQINRRARKTAPGAVDRQKRRFKPGTVALREIRKLQKSTEFMINKLPFQRLVREIVESPTIKGYKDFTYRFQLSALNAMQDGAESYIHGLFIDSVLCMAHAKRVTMLPADMRLAAKIRGQEYHHYHYSDPKDPINIEMADKIQSVKDNNNKTSNKPKNNETMNNNINNINNINNNINNINNINNLNNNTNNNINDINLKDKIECNKEYNRRISEVIKRRQVSKDSKSYNLNINNFKNLNKIKNYEDIPVETDKDPSLILDLTGKAISSGYIKTENENENIEEGEVLEGEKNDNKEGDKQDD